VKEQKSNKKEEIIILNVFLFIFPFHRQTMKLT